MDGYEIVNFIGEGRFSSIFKVRSLKEKKDFILKKLKYDFEEAELKKVYEKFQKIALINHPNILKYHEIAYDDKTKNFCLLVEFADKGDLQTKLSEFLHLGKIIEEEQIWTIFFQLLKALKSLHSQKLLHRALKPSNVLLTSEGTIKIGDINIFEGGGYSKIAIPNNYLSPELWDSANYTEKCDIWSLGCLIYEICVLKPAFRGENIEELKKKILRGYFPPISKEYSSDLELLIQTLLKTDSAKRPSTRQILELDFVIRNFNNLIEKNAFNQGLKFPEIRHVYANNPFENSIKKLPRSTNAATKSRKQKTKNLKNIEKSTPSKKISTIYENTILALPYEIQSKPKYPHSNQTIRKMKESYEKIRIRKRDFETSRTLIPQMKSLSPKGASQMISFPMENIPKSTYRFLKKNTQKKKETRKISENNDNNPNESHFIDINNETKLPAIEKSRIMSNKEKNMDSMISERANSIPDKRFVTRNVSFNQFMINKIKNENPQVIRDSRIISLKEIHQKYVLM